jgi:hypothetical protein
MIRKALLSFLFLGTIVGASAMFDIMLERPLLDYSIEGITLYTQPLYSLGNNIFQTIVGNLIIQATEIIRVFSNIINVTIQFFGWLSNQLGFVINGVVEFLESLGIEINTPTEQPGCVLINGRWECF